MDMTIDKTELSNYLSEAGCCQMCVLRFLKPRMNDFLNADESLKRKTNDHVDKKLKSNPCVLCFGIFDLLDSLVLKICNDEALMLYEVNKFLTSFSLPLSLNLVQLQMWLGLQEKFPEWFDEQKAPDISVKDTLKHIVNDKLSSELKKDVHVEGLMISITFVHHDEKGLFDKLASAAPERMKEWNSRRKKDRSEIISRTYFEKNFNPETMDVKSLRRQGFSIPPDIPKTSMRLEKIEFTGPTVFLAGRYNKFSRKLSQTPWIVGGKRLAENSVEDIMVEAILPHFKVISGADTSVTFMSSGREDVDVRCLGRGRPFALEIVNAKRETLDPTSFNEIEEKVRQSTLISIRDLQMVQRNDLHQIKTGEEEKRKFYRALCILRHESVSEEILEKLQIDKPFEILQWTPIRVLHRRSLLKRPRMIYSVKAFAIKDKPNQLVLDIVTQAGTYVKELVHGEHRRTQPSIASIVEKSIDIVSLDVMNIDLNFPPSTER